MRPVNLWLIEVTNLRDRCILPDLQDPCALRAELHAGRCRSGVQHLCLLDCLLGCLEQVMKYAESPSGQILQEGISDGPSLISALVTGDECMTDGTERGSGQHKSYGSRNFRSFSTSLLSSSAHDPMSITVHFNREGCWSSALGNKRPSRKVRFHCGLPRLASEI